MPIVPPSTHRLDPSGSPCTFIIDCSSDVCGSSRARSHGCTPGAPPPTRLGGLIRPCVSARASNAAPSLLVTSSVSASSKRADVPRHACLACMSQPATMLVVAATRWSRVSTSRLCAAASPVGCVRRVSGSRWRQVGAQASAAVNPGVASPQRQQAVLRPHRYRSGRHSCWMTWRTAMTRLIRPLLHCHRSCRGHQTALFSLLQGTPTLSRRRP